MTFSIVAYDPAAQEWGVATQSKFLAVGAVVPWARAKAGAAAAVLADVRRAAWFTGASGLVIVCSVAGARRVTRFLGAFAIS